MFRNGVCAFDNLLELQAYAQDEPLSRVMVELRDEALGRVIVDVASPHSPGSAS